MRNNFSGGIVENFPVREKNECGSSKERKIVTIIKEKQHTTMLFNMCIRLSSGTSSTTINSSEISFGIVWILKRNGFQNNMAETTCSNRLLSVFTRAFVWYFARKLGSDF